MEAAPHAASSSDRTNRNNPTVMIFTVNAKSQCNVHFSTYSTSVSPTNDARENGKGGSGRRCAAIPYSSIWDRAIQNRRQMERRNNFDVFIRKCGQRDRLILMDVCFPKYHKTSRG